MYVQERMKEIRERERMREINEKCIIQLFQARAIIDGVLILCQILEIIHMQNEPTSYLIGEISKWTIKENSNNKYWLCVSTTKYILLFSQLGAVNVKDLHLFFLFIFNVYKRQKPLKNTKILILSNIPSSICLNSRYQE